ACFRICRAAARWVPAFAGTTILGALAGSPARGMGRRCDRPHIVTPAKAGVHASADAVPEKWVPAFAGTTILDDFGGGAGTAMSAGEPLGTLIVEAGASVEWL